MITLTNFATRLKKEVYKRNLNTTPKQAIKDLAKEEDLLSARNKMAGINKDLRTSLNASVKEAGEKSKGFKGFLPKPPAKNSSALATITKTTKPKVKLSTGKLALGVAGLGLAAAGINKLRKSRSDKGQKRGQYSK